MNQASEDQIRQELAQTLKRSTFCASVRFTWDYRLRCGHCAEFVFLVTASFVAVLAELRTRSDWRKNHGRIG